jgi:hypothetical protein
MRCIRLVGRSIRILRLELVRAVRLRSHSRRNDVENCVCISIAHGVGVGGIPFEPESEIVKGMGHSTEHLILSSKHDRPHRLYEVCCSESPFRAKPPSGVCILL